MVLRDGRIVEDCDRNLRMPPAAHHAGRTCRKHVLRTLLTTAGIVLGVAVFVGMHTANQSVLFAFSQTVDRIAGKTRAAGHRRRSGLRRGRARSRPVAAGRVASRCRSSKPSWSPNLEGQGNLLVLGVDMTGDRSLRDYDLDGGDDDAIDDPLIFLAQPDSLIVSKEFADRNGLRSAAGCRCGRPTATGPFTIRGIMKPRRAGQRVRRQPGRHGRLRRAEDVRARPHVRSDRRRGEGRHRRSPKRERRPARPARARLRRPAAGRPRPAGRIDARRLHDDGEHLERLRAVHRDVHHLQLVRRSP